MDDIYKEQIMDHYRHPRNFGDLEDADVVVREANASCGDMLQLALKLAMDNGQWKIKAIKFKSIGCAISTAAASLLTEGISNGKWTMDKLKKLKDEDMAGLLGIELSPTRMRCAMLPLRAVQRGLEEYESS